MSALRRRWLAALALLGSAIACGAASDRDAAARPDAGGIAFFDDLYSVAVVDADHVVAVGYHGTALRSDDGGETWRNGGVPTDRALYSVSMADREHGWAVGQQGVILRTRDGGRTWTLQRNPKADEESHLLGVHALDADRALAVGIWGARVHTSDGGRTWNDRSMTIGIDHPQFVWLEAALQERVQGGGRVYEDVGLQDVTCLRGTSECWAVGEFGSVYRSPDGGVTWERGEVEGGIPMLPIRFDEDRSSLDAEDAQALADFAAKIADETHQKVWIDPFVSDREIAAHYRSGDPEELFDLISARTGEVSRALEERGLASDRVQVTAAPPWDYADWTEHDPAFLSRYVDGRRSREARVEVSAVQSPFLFSVRFQDASLGLASGLGGVVLRSEDGGRRWSYAKTPRRQALFAIAAAGDRAIAVGEKGLVQYSPDRGVSWLPSAPRQLPPVFTFLRDLRFAPGETRTGFIVGEASLVLRTRDAGESWTQVLP